MTVIVAVIDTNVLVSGIITKDSDSFTGRILDGMLQGKFYFLLSDKLISEYRDVLLRKRIRKVHGLSEEEIDEILTDLSANGMFREVIESKTRTPDRDDQHLWDLLAVYPGACLVTGDKLLIENAPENAAVFTPRRFVDIHDRL